MKWLIVFVGLICLTMGFRGRFNKLPSPIVELSTTSVQCAIGVTPRKYLYYEFPAMNYSDCEMLADMHGVIMVGGSDLHPTVKWQGQINGTHAWVTGASYLTMVAVEKSSLENCVLAYYTERIPFDGPVNLMTPLLNEEVFEGERYFFEDFGVMTYHDCANVANSYGIRPLNPHLLTGNYTGTYATMVQTHTCYGCINYEQISSNSFYYTSCTDLTQCVLGYKDPESYCGICSSPNTECKILPGGNLPYCGCPKGFFGESCDQECTCQMGFCDDYFHTGTCFDLVECEEGFYGTNCLPCTCQNGVCDDGISGDGKCVDCDSNGYGEDCVDCICENGNCDYGINGTGSCIGECFINGYGENCVDCLCENGNCDYGINGTGGCVGDCFITGFGEYCIDCTCQNGTCDWGINGSGICAGECTAPLVFGENCLPCTCLVENGVCDEGKNYSGTCLECQKNNLFGPDCDQVCDCTEFGGCRDGPSGDGLCRCEAGYFGTNCSFNCLDCLNGECDDGSYGTGYCTCDDGYYGVLCTEQCHCVEGECDDGAIGDGTCTCHPGWYDTNCDSECSCQYGLCHDGVFGSGECICMSGFYGSSCNSSCECENGVCDEGSNGSGTCSCFDGFSGTFCDAIVTEVNPFLVVSIITIVVILALIGIIIYLRVATPVPSPTIESRLQSPRVYNPKTAPTPIYESPRAKDSDIRNDKGRTDKERPLTYLPGED